MRSKLLVHLLLVLLVAIISFNIQGASAAPQVPAFPGAVGFGTGTPGGRGGKVLYVTNLNDSGSGSLREALTASGARTVLFRVSGTISLNGDIDISNPFLTVAGQTAPGEGVQVRGAQLKIQTHDVIIRYLKVRSGDAPSSSSPADRDAVTLNPGSGGDSVYNVVVDHSTMIWGPDVAGITFLNGSRDATVSYSIIGEGLYASNHPEGVVSQDGHTLGINITELNSGTPPTRITVHHNLITTSGDRNPRVIGGANIDLVNNVIYNWSSAAAQGNPRSVNLIGNMFIKGPMTTKSSGFYCWKPKVESGGSQRSGVVYETGNACDQGLTMRGEPASVYTGSRFSPYSMGGAEDSASAAYNNVVNDAGANRNVANANGDITVRRDADDQRIINNLTSRKGTFLNGVGKGGIGGYPEISWPNLAGGTAAVDNDNDGMPDAWEQKYFGNTSRGSSSNSSGDLDGDGYSDLEEYLNGTDPGGGVTLPSDPTPEPTAQPTAQPTVQPTGQPTPEPTSLPGSGENQHVFTPSDDATVMGSQPAANFGSSKLLTADNNPQTMFYLKFGLSGLNGSQVTSAKLRLYSQGKSPDGGEVKLVADNSWQEGKLTWQNRPETVGDTAAKLGEVASGSWYEFDLTSLVKGDGTYSFGIQSSNSDGADYQSKEGSNVPQLVVEVQPASPTSEPTAEPTQEPTTEPTVEPTTQPTAEPTSPPVEPASMSMVFTPSDDATVLETKAGDNFGSEKLLTADDSPRTMFYMKFQVNGVNGAKVTSAKIRLFCKDNSEEGGKLRFVKNNDWKEGKITWKNRPEPEGDVISKVEKAEEGTWYEFDVTSLVTSDGTFSFRIHSPNSNGVDYFSKEGNNSPELVVEVKK